MTDLETGQAVHVRIDGVEHDATVDAPSHASTHVWVRFDGLRWYVPVARIARVTPPCPWTEIGTYVLAGHEVFVLSKFGWLTTNEESCVDWAVDIAPHNPRRLIPEDRVEAAIADVEQKVDAAQAVLNRIQPLREHLPALEAVLRGVSVDDALAKYPPARLVPEQPARKALRDRHGGIWRPMDAYETNGVPWDRARIAEYFGPVTEVDGPAVAS